MGKKKKITEKLRTFYRGPVTKPTKIATEDEMQIINNALTGCIPLRDYAFKTNWNSEVVLLKLAIGLSSSLRCLKQKRARAIIYDDTAPQHLTKYLKEFAANANVPIIQAHKLIDLAPKFNLKTLMVISLVDPAYVKDSEQHLPNYVKPKPVKDIIVSESFEKLGHLLAELSNTTLETQLTYQRPDILKCKTESDKSRSKKREKKEAKQKNLSEKQAASQKQTHVGEAS